MRFAFMANDTAIAQFQISRTDNYIDIRRRISGFACPKLPIDDTTYLGFRLMEDNGCVSGLFFTTAPSLRDIRGFASPQAGVNYGVFSRRSDSLYILSFNTTIDREIKLALRIATADSAIDTTVYYEFLHTPFRESDRFYPFTLPIQAAKLYSSVGLRQVDGRNYEVWAYVPGREGDDWLLTCGNMSFLMGGAVYGRDLEYFGATFYYFYLGDQGTYSW
jgi:hypothetical protein